MSEAKKCPIWGVPCEDVEDAPDTRKHRVQSSRAGGRYTITEDALHMVEGWGDMEKAKLSRWIYEQNQLGTVPKINSAVVKQALNWPMPSVLERIDFLLQFAELQTRNTAEAPVLYVPSGSLEAHLKSIADHTFDHTQQKLNEICAATATVPSSPGALDYLMSQADKAGFVTFNSRRSDGRVIARYVEITMKGYKRL